MVMVVHGLVPASESFEVHFKDTCGDEKPARVANHILNVSILWASHSWCKGTVPKAQLRDCRIPDLKRCARLSQEFSMEPQNIISMLMDTLNYESDSCTALDILELPCHQPWYPSATKTLLRRHPFKLFLPF